MRSGENMAEDDLYADLEDMLGDKNVNVIGGGKGFNKKNSKSSKIGGFDDLDDFEGGDSDDWDFDDPVPLPKTMISPSTQAV